MLIRLGHSPDPDDAFMFWALAAGAVDTRGFEFEQVLQDIQTLNEWALHGKLEVTAISLHAYPFVQDRYALLPHGASIGHGYGPVVVAREPLTLDQLRELEIVVPGGRRLRSSPSASRSARCEYGSSRSTASSTRSCPGARTRGSSSTRAS